MEPIDPILESGGECGSIPTTALGCHSQEILHQGNTVGIGIEICDGKLIGLLLALSDQPLKSGFIELEILEKIRPIGANCQSKKGSLPFHFHNGQLNNGK